MTVRAKASKTPESDTIRKIILDATSELLEQHAEEIEEIRLNSEDKTIAVKFGHSIDGSESEMTIKTTIRFCETFTDERTNRVTDSAQGTFETIESAGRGGRKDDGAPSED